MLKPSLLRPRNLHGYFTAALSYLLLFGIGLALASAPARASEAPVLSYSFDEGHGAFAHDSAGGPRATINGAQWTHEGKYGAALKFDGENDRLTVPQSESLDLAEEGFTLEAWIRPEALHGTPAPLLVKERSAEPFYSYLVNVQNGSGFPSVEMIGEGEAEAELTGPSILWGYSWYHLAVTSDGEEMHIYVDGVLKASGPAIPLLASDGDLQIGGSTALAHYFEGKIDELRIYDHALNGEEVAEDRDTSIEAPNVNPLAAYSFDEGKGETAHDSAGTHDGTIHGAEWSEAGKFGAALQFNGESDRVTVPASEELDLSEAFTLEAWVRPSAAGTDAPILVKEDSGESLPFGYLLDGQGEEGKPSLRVAEDESHSAQIAGTEALPVGEWSHLAVTSDGEELRLYVDGKLKASGAALPAKASDGALQIGGSPALGQYFKGKIDEVRLYDRALDAEEVEEDGEVEIEPAQPRPRDPLAAYSFDEGKGETAHDSAGTHDGTIHGAEWSEAGKFGAALQFNGESDRVTVPASEELDLSEAFTLEAWVRPSAAGTDAPILVKEDSGESLPFGYLLDGQGEEGKPSLRVAEDESHSAQIAGTEALPVGEWSHLAVTSDGEELRLYVDGKLKASGAALPAKASDGALQIGGSPALGQYFKGKIDEVRLYDRALDAEEVEEDGEAAVLAGFQASISGAAQQGQVLVADFGNWIGSRPVSFDYQWERCNAEGASCEDLEGERYRTYGLSSSDVGHTLRVRIEAEPGPIATSRSSATGTVLEASPGTQSTPLIYGHLAVGKTVSTEVLEWWPETAAIAYQWRRCDSEGASCEDIAGAISQHYALQSADIGATLRVREAATTNGGSAEVESDASEVVPAPLIANTTAPSIRESAGPSGTVLHADPGAWSGEEIALGYRWLRCDGAGGECTALPEEREATFLPQADEAGSSYRVQVEASNASESQLATSAATAALEETEPALSNAPVLFGRARAGRTLEAEPGAWTGLGPTKRSSQWLRCDAAGEACEAIPGATEDEYELGSEDVGSTIRVKETLANSAGSAPATSAATAVVASASRPGPVLEADPSIAGETEVGSILTASAGTWGGAVEYAYQWQRCDASGQLCEPINEASEETYELGSEDVGHVVAVEVTAEGEDEGTSSATALTGQSVRLPEGPRNLSAPALEGSAEEGAILSVEAGIWEGGEPINFAYRWQRCEAGECVDIAGASGESYEVSGDDVLHTLRAVVTAENEAGETSAVSAMSLSVGAQIPFDETAPTLSGGDRTGESLTAKPGTWQGAAPITFSYSWLRCDSAGASCEEIPGAEGAGYELSGADAGATIRASIEASNGKGTSQARSAPSVPISDASGPTSLSAPTIGGEPVAGESLSAAHGEWEGAEGFGYQWQRCGLEQAGSECVNIAGATGATYTVGNLDTESALRVLVSATGSGGVAFALSGETEGVESRDLPAPQSEEPPTIEGTSEEFQTLSVDLGKWKSQYPLSYRYQWESCDAGGKGCVAIEGATSSTYTLQWWNVGGTVRVVVIASGENSGRAVVSAPSEEVVQAPPSNLEAPFIESGKAMDQETLSANFGNWQGDDLSYSWEWELCDPEGKECEPAEEGEGETYKLRSSQIGHTVRVRVRMENEVGWTSATSAASEVIAPRPPEPGGLPEISGDMLQDGVLEGYEGWWWGTLPLSFSYQWQRCNSEGEECEDISGATESEYTAAAADVGSRLRLKVKASSEYGSAEAFSEPSAVIAPPSLPSLGSPGPSIEGMPYDGRTFTAKPGNWSGHAPIGFSYQWQRCSKEGKECKNITGATAAVYTTTSADLNATIRANVTASNTSGSASEASAVSKAISSAEVANTSVPTISGKNQPGSTLEGSTGAWSGSGPLEFAYEWQRCNASGKECKAIEGANKAGYTIQPADGRKTLRVNVTATGALGSASASSSTLSILPEPSSNSEVPVISGTQVVESKLTASSGEWTPVPDSYAYQWQRCSAEGTGCFNLSGQTSAGYTPVFADRGKTLRVRVTAENEGESEPPVAFSSVTGIIVTRYPSIIESPVLSTTEPVAEQKVTATTGVWSGLPTISYSYQWQHCFSPIFTSLCSNIPGATESSYVIDAEYTGQYLRVVVRALNSEGGDEWPSAISGQIGEGNPPPPENTSTPTIEGAVVVGSPLTANPGTWNGASFWGYQWQRCSAEGKECADIASASGKGYTPVAADIGHALRVVVTGFGFVGTGYVQASASSEPSEPVAEATRPSSESPPSIEGSAEIGETLVGKGGVWSGSPTIESSFVWLRCDPLGRNCEAISKPTSEFESQHPVSNADAGHTVRLRETSANGWGSVTVLSKATSIVPAAPPLENLGLPELQFGTPSFHSTYWASQGKWSGVPDLEAQWERCDPLTLEPEEESIECIDIPGATDFTISPSAADVGYKLRLRETAVSGKENVTVHSELTSAAVAVGIENKGVTITGLAVPGATITAHSGLSLAAELPSEIEYQFWRVEGGSFEELQSGPSPEYEVQEADLGGEIEAYAVLTAWRADKAFVVAEDANWAFTPEVEVGPTNDSLPLVSGEAVAGATLEAEPGEWHGGGGSLSFAYQWRRCDEEGKACEDISGADDPTYEVGKGDIGSTVKVAVTASNWPVSGVAESEPSEIVQAAEAPSAEEPPSVYGEAIETRTLEAEPGVWTGSGPLSYSYQWQGCEPEDPGSCLDIEDANESALRLDRSVVGQSLRVVVTATNAGGGSTAVSELTEPVEAAPAPTPTEAPSITLLGPPAEGSTLMTDGGSWEYVNPDEFEYQWLRCPEGGECEAVEGADNPTYELGEEDVGARLQVEVVGENSAGRISVTSELSPEIGESTGSLDEKIVYLDPSRKATYSSDLAGESQQEIIDCQSLTGESSCELHDPRISPNGELLVVEARSGEDPVGSGAIWVMNFDGSEPREFAQGSEPDWSADGTELYFTVEGEEAGATAIAVASADQAGSEAEPVQSLPASASGASLSPDGRMLAFSGRSSTEGSSGLFVGTVGDSPTRVDLGSRVIEAFNPVFSADGSEIIFRGSSPEPDWGSESPSEWGLLQLWAVRPNGSDLHRLVPQNTDTFGPPSAGGFGVLAERRHVTWVNFGGGGTFKYSEPEIWGLDEASEPRALPVSGLEPDSITPLTKTFGPIDYNDCFHGHSPCDPWHVDDREEARRYALKWSHEGDRNPKFRTDLEGTDCTNFASQVWHIPGQKFMREPLNRGYGPWSWWSSEFNATQSWIGVEKFIEQQQAQSERAKDLHELPPSQWKLGDVIVFNWANGGEPHDHLAVVTEAGEHPKISQHSTDRRDFSWEEDRKKVIPKYVKEIGGDPQNWRYYILRPRFKAANIPQKYWE